MRRWLRWIRAGMLARLGGVWWARRRLRAEGAVVVVALHRVLEDADLERTNSLPGIILRRPTFEGLAEHVSRSYEAVDLARPIPRGPGTRLRIALTFDDGWIDNYAAAFPIARSHGIPITVFVCPGLAGRQSPFWPERLAASIRTARPSATSEEIEAVVERLKPCSPDAQRIAAAVRPDGADSTIGWDGIRRMAGLGVVIGAHTQTHQILTTLPSAAARVEIRESKSAIEQALGSRCDLFAYPNGNHSAQTRALVAGAGFRLAFTVERGAWMAATDPFAIPRVNLSESDVADPGGGFSPAMFDYTVVWKAWRASRQKR
jgi:peptidoglycan/xylan/chitin deacetylase (PgdA/CDA1 family)